MKESMMNLEYLVYRYKRAMLRVVCWPRVKTRLSRVNGEKELDLWPTSSFSSVRHAYPPTRRRSGFLGHGCTRGRETLRFYIIPTWTTWGGSSSSPTTTGELTFRASSKSRSAVDGFSEQTTASRDSFEIKILPRELCTIPRKHVTFVNRRIIVSFFKWKKKSSS